MIRRRRRSVDSVHVEATGSLGALWMKLALREQGVHELWVGGCRKVDVREVVSSRSARYPHAGRNIHSRFTDIYEDVREK